MTDQKGAGGTMCSIRDLQKQTFAIAKEKGWHDEPRTFGDVIALAHSELSEALEAFRKKGKPRETWYRSDGKPEGVPSELADVVIRLMDVCETYGIDLESAIKEKMTFNRTRTHRHGGKFL